MKNADADLWIFGYGSLMWRPDFPHLEVHPGTIEGWSRRFWQASTDHRGTPDAPGRVVTLVGDPGATCWGSAFRVAASERASVLDRLDHRERGGFDRHRVEVRLAGEAPRRVSALMYVAGPDNENYAGPTPLAELARVVASAVGPSGSNHEYVVELARALRTIGAEDAHVFEVAAAVGSPSLR